MRKGVKSLGFRAAVGLCGVSVHVIRWPLWAAAALGADDPLFWVDALSSQNAQPGWESAGWILVTACLLSQGPLHYGEKVYLFLYLSWDSETVLPSARCVTFMPLHLGCHYEDRTLHSGPGHLGWSITSYNMTLSKSLISVGLNILVWKMEVNKLENLQESPSGLKKLGH